jgi:hypothetical protein
MQLIEILNHSNKIKTINDLLNHFDSIVEIAKDDVYKIAKSKQLLFSDFDFAYADAFDMLRNQLKKSHLKGISKFLKCRNITNAVSWLVERLLNNMRNITTNKKYKLFCRANFVKLHENISIVNDDNRSIELLDLEKVDKKTIKKGLKDIWDEAKYDSDFDFEDFEELCCKFKFNAREVVGSDTLAQLKFSKYQVSNKHYQLELLF